MKNSKKSSSQEILKKRKTESARFFEIDFLRGIAVLMMVVFHFFWDTNFFGLTNYSLYTGFFGIFQKLTAGAFLLLAGVSLSISYGRNKVGFEKKFLFRALKIFGFGAVLTLFSLAFFPSEPIFFGVLHLIGFSIFLSVFFVKKKYLNLILGLLIIFLPAIFNLQSIQLNYLFWVGLGKSVPALDFFPIVPWFGAVLLGLFFGNAFYRGTKPKIVLQKPDSKTLDLVCFLGRNSLLIYFAHQPVLFSLVWAAKFFLFKAG